MKRKDTRTNENMVFSALFTNFHKTKILFFHAVLYFRKCNSLVPRLKNSLYFRKWNFLALIFSQKNDFLIFREMELCYISGNGNPQKIPYILGKGTVNRTFYPQPRLQMCYSKQLMD